VKQDVCVLAILVFLLNQAILILVIGANNVKFEILTVVTTICTVVYHYHLLIEVIRIIHAVHTSALLCLACSSILKFL